MGICCSWGKSVERLYKWCSGSYDALKKYNTFARGYGDYDGKTVLDPEDDAAYMNWGREWRMPSSAQFEELINPSYTTIEMTTLNGVYGGRVLSRKNGNSIFLPLAGHRNMQYLYDVGRCSYYWTSELYDGSPSTALALYFESEYCVYVDNCYRCYGYSVRPVRAL